MPLVDYLLVDEATEELITSERKRRSVVCSDDDSQVINVKVEDIAIDLEDRVVVKLKFRLCYKYRRLLDLTLLGCRMKVHTVLKTTSAPSLKSVLQKRLNMICDGNHLISIRLFFININQLINNCKWISSVEDVYPICTLYHIQYSNVINANEIFNNT
ncbi:U1 protein [Faba bean necrotic stunt virus]|uniref:U1 protein n=1 Tax=Faba bean necrotic stunt virus TaxID=283824 RepID=C7DLN7_9VIRU|nr:U1 protein [Faba bean necrotic stunt virus]ACU00026.1 U1 protein [Faba bean necrotic stunt virus]